MAQVAHPTSTIAYDVWTGTPNTGSSLHLNVDEDYASLNTSDYDYSPNQNNTTIQFGLTSLTDPADSTGHIMRVVACQTNGGTPDGSGNSIGSQTAYLYQGATLIATMTFNPGGSGTWTAYTYTLSAAEADAITDYTALQFWIDAAGSGGPPSNRRGLGIALVDFTVPSVAVPIVKVISETTQSSETTGDVLAQPTFGVTDTFTDTNGTLLTAHTPDSDAVGTGWEGSSQFEIQGNAAEFVGASADQFIGVDLGDTSLDMTVDIDLSGGVADWPGVWFNGGVSGGGIPSNCWFIEADSGFSYELFERVGGVRTSRAVTTAVIPGTGTETWRVVVKSDSIHFYVDNKLVLRYAPGGSLSYLGTYAGIKTGSAGYVAWDNFSVITESNYVGEVAAVYDNLTIVPASSYFGDVDPLYWIGYQTPAVECCFRFLSVNIPQGATINSAYINGFSRNAWLSDIDTFVTVRAEAVDNAAQVVDYADFQSKSANVGTQSAFWGSVDANGLGEPQVSTDLAAVIQEVINRAGWVSGNALQLFTVSNVTSGEDQQLYSYYNAVADYYPSLIINYTTASGASLVEVVAETQQSSDAQARALAIARLQAETEQAVSTQARARAVARLRAEQLQEAEAQARARTMAREQADTVQASSTQPTARALARIQSATQQISETAAQIRGLAQVVADAVQLAEAAAYARGQVQSVAESAQIPEGSAHARGLAVLAAEALQVGSAQATARALARLASEAMQIASAQIRARTMARHRDEAAQVASGQLRARTMARTRDEQETSAEVASFVRGRVQILSAVVQALEGTIANRALARAAAEAVQSVEAAEQAIGRVQVASETVNPVESSGAPGVITPHNHLTNGGTGSNATSYATASVSPTADALVLLTVASNLSGATPPNPTVSGCNLTWSLVETEAYDTAGTYYSVWVYKGQGSSPTAGTITVDFGATTVGGLAWSVDEFEGAHATSPIVQTAKDGAGQPSATGATVTLAAFSDAANGTFGAFSWEANEAGSIGTGFTEAGQGATSGPSMSVLAEYRADNDTTVDASWTTSAQWGAIAMEIQPASSGGGNGILYVLAQTIVRAVSDTVNVASTQAAIRALVRLLAEAESVAESAGTARALARALAEAESVPESADLARALARSADESVAISEALQAAMAIARATTDAVTGNENLARARNLARLALDSIAVQEGTAHARGLVAAIADAVQLIDAVAAARSVTRLAIEAMNLPEGSLTARGLARLASDSLQATEATLRAMAKTRTSDETVQIAETAIEQITAALGLVKVITEQLASVEGLARGRALARLTDEQVAGNESLAASRDLARSVAATVQSVAGSAIAVGRSVVASETLQVGETTARSLAAQLLRVISDVLQLADSPATARALGRQVLESTTVADLRDLSRSLARIRAESAAISEDAQHARGVVQVVAEVLAVAGTAAYTIVTGVGAAVEYLTGQLRVRAAGLATLLFGAGGSATVNTKAPGGIVSSEAAGDADLSAGAALEGDPGANE